MEVYNFLNHIIKQLYEMWSNQWSISLVINDIFHRTYLKAHAITLYERIFNFLISLVVQIFNCTHIHTIIDIEEPGLQSEGSYLELECQTVHLHHNSLQPKQNHQVT